jgi:hypothetical protein
VSLRPKQHDYASYVGYTRALEAYCDGLEQAEPVVEPVTEAVEPVVVQAEPVGWLCSPDGHFKRNPLYRVEFPPESLAWQVPIYAAPQQQAEPAADSGNPSY